MPVNTLLLIILVLALVGVFPAWPYSRGWGYSPVTVLLVVVLILVVLRVI